MKIYQKCILDGLHIYDLKKNKEIYRGHIA